MLREILPYYLVVVYLSLVIAVCFKFYNKGVRGVYLLISIVVPIGYGFLASRDLFARFINFEGNIITKISKTIHWIKILFIAGFPLAVAMMGEIIVKAVKSANKGKKNKKKPHRYLLNPIFFPSSKFFNTIEDVNSEKLKLV